ncbi:MAG: helix-turn-helix domain-containing protein [Myxococcota bacterium]
MRRFTVGRRRVDLDTAEIHDRSEVTALTPNEVKVLGVLAAHAGQVVERDVLLCEALGYRKAISTRAIDQTIWRLRRKLEPEPHAPRWLLSEANVGYRLELDPPPPPSLLGRHDELARLLALLDEAAGPVYVVGLPGSGRRTLAAAAAQARGEAEPAVAIAAHVPPGTPHLRLGPLAPDAGRALLVRDVLTARGGAGLTDDEEEQAAAAAARAGHHPATLRAMAEASVLYGFAELPVPALPAVAAHVEALPVALRALLRRCAPFPDAFHPAEAGVAPGELAEAWRASVLDAVDGPAGRRLVVPAPVRAVLDAPDPAATRTFVDRVVADLGEVSLELVGALTRPARDAVRAAGPRIAAAWAAAAPDQRAGVLPLTLARWVADDALPDPLPDPDPPLPPDAAVCRDVLLAVAAEQGDRAAGGPWIARALDHDASPPRRLRAAVRRVPRDVARRSPGAGAQRARPRPPGRRAPRPRRAPRRGLHQLGHPPPASRRARARPPGLHRRHGGVLPRLARAARPDGQPRRRGRPRRPHGRGARLVRPHGLGHLAAPRRRGGS